MDILSSKFSLYDFLAMVIPGGTILLFLHVLFLSVQFPMNVISGGIHNMGNVFYGIIIITLAYIIGLGNHLLAGKIWAGLRNNPKLIEENFNEVLHRLPKDNNVNLLYNSKKHSDVAIKGSALQDYILGGYWMLFSVFIVSLIFHVISVSLSSSKFFVCLAWICIILGVLLCLLSLAYVFFIEKNENNILINAYYEAYYFVQQKNKNGDVFVMEAQVAFLQSMFIPLALFLCLPPECVETIFSISPKYNECYICFLLKVPLALLWLSILPTIYSRINKIHNRVWEDYEYLKRLEKNNPRN